MNATTIAATHYNSIVKILLIDSAAEKKKPGSGYLGRGSGFFVTDDGLIFTNRHVVKYGLGLKHTTDYDRESREFYSEHSIYAPENLEESHYSINHIGHASIIVQVFTNRNGSTSDLFTAKVIAIDTGNYDGAILRIVSGINGARFPQKFNPVQIANSDSTYQGEDLCLYGFPAQYDGAVDVMLRDQSTLTFGKHSGFDYVVNSDYGFIKTDAAINSGNSGGPVFNKDNKVIGISTAASNKTNMGFIAGINGMYYIVHKDEAIAAKLALQNIQPPGNKNVRQSGIVANPTLNVPSAETIKKYNVDQKNLRNFKGGFWYLRGFVGLTTNDHFVMDPYTGDGEIVVNSGTQLNVKAGSSLQAEIGKVFSLWRIDPVNKLSLDWTILSYGRYAYDWTNADIFYVPSGTQFTYSSTYLHRWSTKLGIMYSHMFSKRFAVDLYYKAAPTTMVEEEEAIRQTLTYKDPTAPDSSRYAESSVYYDGSLGIIHGFGLNVRYKQLMVGLEYNTGVQGFDFYDVLFVQSYDNYVSHAYGGTTGKHYLRNFHLTFGVYFGGKKRWKHLGD